MRMKSQNGVTLIMLVITVIVLGILTSITIEEVGNIIRQVNLETVSTNLLLVQAKAKVISEKVNFNNDESLLKGSQLSGITGDSDIESLKSSGIISEDEENYDKYYMWDKETVEELEIGITDMEEYEFYIVNYETEEVIYSKGYKHTDGITYFKLSEITGLE